MKHQSALIAFCLTWFASFTLGDDVWRPIFKICDNSTDFGGYEDFDVTNDLLSWFSQSHLVESSYADLNATTYVDHFTLQGK